MQNTVNFTSQKTSRKRYVHPEFMFPAFTVHARRWGSPAGIENGCYQQKQGILSSSFPGQTLHTSDQYTLMDQVLFGSCVSFHLRPKCKINAECFIRGMR